MPHISILLSSVRTNRNSHRVAYYFKNYLEENNLSTVEILDLKEYAFPIFEERLAFHSHPSNAMLEFSKKIVQSDGIIIVTPEYNGGYPASLKNVIDLLYEEWFHKPIAISTVSDGGFGGTQVIMSLQFSLWKIKAWTVPATFHVSHVEENYSEEGHPVHKIKTDMKAHTFVHALFWCIEAKNRMSDT